MELLTKNDIKDTDLRVLQSWGMIDRSIVSFENNATPKTFSNLFGEDGSRLWGHYVRNCDRTWKKFRTYLTDDQFNTFLINVYLNTSIYV